MSYIITASGTGIRSHTEVDANLKNVVMSIRSYLVAQLTVTLASVNRTDDWFPSDIVTMIAAHMDFKDILSLASLTKNRLSPGLCGSFLKHVSMNFVKARVGVGHARVSPSPQITLSQIAATCSVTPTNISDLDDWYSYIIDAAISRKWEIIDQHIDNIITTDHFVVPTSRAIGLKSKLDSVFEEYPIDKIFDAFERAHVSASGLLEYYVDLITRWKNVCTMNHLITTTKRYTFRGFTNIVERYLHNDNIKAKYADVITK